jgi:hypothetical protein
MFVEEIDTSKIVRNKKPIKVVGRSSNLRRETNVSTHSSRGGIVPANRFDTKRGGDEGSKMEMDARRNKTATE